MFSLVIHTQILFSASKRGVNRSIIAIFRKMFTYLKVKSMVPRGPDMKVSAEMISVRKGIWQGAITSSRWIIKLLLNHSSLL